MSKSKISKKDLDPRLKDKLWRINHLYKIKNKDREVVTFRLNRAQADFHANKHTRNIILKSRQLGMTTYAAIDALDDVLFEQNTDALMRSYDLVSQLDIFNDKIYFAWNNLPTWIQELYTVDAERANMLRFNWGDNTTTSITVRLHGRSGTFSRMHISEFAKICKNSPDDADEIITGNLPAVPMTGRVDIESTAEGDYGDFHDMFWEAWNRGAPTMPVQFKAFFYNWQYDDAELKNINPITTAEMESSATFAEYQKKHNLTDREITYYYYRWLSVNKDWARLRREFPTTCVVGETLVDSVEGMKKIEDVSVDGEKIVAKYDQGVKDVYEITTSLGYSLQATEDHMIMLVDGTFCELKDILGKRVKLGTPELNTKIQTVEFFQKPFIKSSIKIDEEFGRFLGYFMGDGSLNGEKGTISIACDRECQDVVGDVEYLLRKFFGEPHTRIVGSKDGCSEVRTSSIDFVRPFFELGILRRNSGGGFKRKVCIPDCIKKSPSPVVKEFIKGLFESDGFVSRDGLNVKFFTKYKDFAREIQILLLSFGVVCKINTKIKKGGVDRKYEYIGYEIVMRKQETIAFKSSFGFVSSKKRNRILQTRKTQKHELKMTFDDMVTSIIPVGKKQVWDITTKTHTFIANGIVVHNCEEAFEASGDKFFAQEPLDRMTPRMPMMVSGHWTYYDDYKPGHRYAVGADPSGGIGKDNATIVVMDFDAKDSAGYLKPEIVAVYASNTIAPDIFANEIKNAGTRYGNCIVAVENNNHGQATLATLKKIYYNIYKEVRTDKLTDVQTERLGWHTNRATKAKMMFDLKTAVNESLLNIPDAITLREFKTYLSDDIGVVGKDDDIKHWDRVIAVAICWQMATYAGIGTKITTSDDGEFNRFGLVNTF